jgi:alanine racemase
MPRPTYAEIDLGAIRANARTIRACLAPGVAMMGVVKADAYGHGSVPVARALQEEGVEMLAVALVEEGALLRQAGIRAPILVMGAMPADEVACAMEHDLRATVTDSAAALQLDRQAAACGKPLTVHLKIDTGMNRLGVRPDELREVAETLLPLRHLVVEGVYTHFACADTEEPEPSRRQLAQFEQAVAVLRGSRLQPLLLHTANSATILSLGPAHLNMVRPGLAIYGITPSRAARGVPLRPALALKSRVVHLKRVASGEGVSYGYTWRAERDSLLGLLPVGYADGYRRLLSNRGRVRVAGQLCPVVGRVCMDTTIIDLTDLPQPAVGLEATLIEADNASPLSAAAVAELCGTIPYEILTGISPRVRREYV